jgi:hypothetical protein
MVKGEKGINGARFYDGKAKNLRPKIKFINPFYFYEKYAKNKNL